MNPNPEDETTIPKKISDWLGSLVKGSDEKQSRRFSLSPVNVSELLQKAAICYASANWSEDACRIFERLGDDRHAAPYHEQMGRWILAAACYSRIADWRNASRCFLAGSQPAEAAECLMKAGESLEAAWILADKAHLFLRAESIARSLSAESDIDRMEIELILARCESGNGSASSASRRLQKVVSQLQKRQNHVFRQQQFDRAIIIAEILNRPDIIAIVHASAVSTGLPGAAEKWESWSMNTLGEDPNFGHYPKIEYDRIVT